MTAVKIGIVGFGKIARDEHVPAIARHPDAELVAVASRNAKADGVANYPDLETMLAERPELDAIALCQPPQARFAAACTALRAGKHVFLEKPPGVTLSEVEILISLAKAQGTTLYASWHSRYADGVARAKAWAADVDGVSAVQDRFTGDGHVTGRAEQFQVILWKGHVVIFSGCHGLGGHCNGHPWQGVLKLRLW